MDIKTDALWLMNGDCLERMREIPDGSVDMVLTDPPYGTTACKWDSIIPFEPMWVGLKRIIKPNGAIVLFGSEPFSSMLRVSNLKMFKYDWVWEKEQGVNPLLAKKQPLNNIEYIHVFYSKLRIITRSLKAVRPTQSHGTNKRVYVRLTVIILHRRQRITTDTDTLKGFSGLIGKWGTTPHKSPSPYSST